MNIESDTPRTDAETMRDEYDHVDTEFGAFAPSNTVSADFARQLERELNEVTSERNNLNASLTAAISSSNARHFESMEYEAKSKQLEIKLNDAMAALRNLTDEIGMHESASMMHPRLTRAIVAATKLTNETK